MDIKHLLTDFMGKVALGEIEVYNEFSLQHELGIFIRSRTNGYKVQFERNTKYFGITGTTKHEIDIVIFNQKERYAIELKYPCNGRYPEEMFDFLKDLCFMEELKNKGFQSTYCMTLVQDKNFYSGNKQNGIYAYFRGNKSIHGQMVKPTGRKDNTLSIHGTYTVDWRTCGMMKYYILEV